MKYLLDTHTYLWLAQSPDRLSPRTLAELANPDNELFVSIASLWEATIKIALGKMRIAGNSVQTLLDGLTLLLIELLPITTAHLLALETLPRLHKDPFDHMLAAQALVEDVPLVTVDRTLQQYGIATVWDG